MVLFDLMIRSCTKYPGPFPALSIVDKLNQAKKFYNCIAFVKIIHFGCVTKIK
jgi:hypothetical protein